MRSNLLGELITLTSESGLLLDGLFFEAPKALTTVVHIHGSYGNFFQAPFLRVLTRQYMASGISLLTLNTSARDGFAEGNFENGDFAYVGGAMSDFSDCVYDIQAAIDFAQQLSKRVILQGHSLGCDRVLHYSIQRSALRDIILLSPCDSYDLQRRWLKDETVEQQISRLRQTAREVETGVTPIDWLESSEYGLRQGPGWTYTLPITRKAFLSIADGPPYKLMNIQYPACYEVAADAAVYIGGNDLLQTSPSGKMFDYLKARLKSMHPLFYQVGDHMLAGCESQVAEALVEWIHSVS